MYTIVLNVIYEWLLLINNDGKVASSKEHTHS